MSRRPYKVTPRVLARIQALRASGKSIEVIAGLCGLSAECVRKWLIGQTPKNLLSTKTLGVGDSGKRGFPVEISKPQSGESQRNAEFRPRACQ